MRMTALQIANRKLTDMPVTESGVIRKADRENWKKYPRKGCGGGYEYHISNLPKEVKKALLNQSLSEATIEQTALVVSEETRLSCDLTPWQRDVIDARLAILEFIDTEAKSFGKNAVIENICEMAKEECLPADLRALLVRANAKSGRQKGKAKATINRKTIYNWYSLQKKHGLIGLAPGLPAEKDYSIPKWAYGVLDIYRQPNKPSIAATLDKYREILPAGAEVPSYHQVKRFINKLSIVTVNKGRMGPQELKKYKAFTRRDTSELWPTACYTSDGHCFKAAVLHPFHGQPFRPELTAVLDVYTGYITGWHAGLSENALDVLYALSDAMIERDDGRHRGIGSLFYTDNGSGFKNNLMNADATGFCERWGMLAPNSIPYNSQARGMIEVLNKNLWVRAAKKHMTYCGKDADKEATRKVTRITDKELRAGKMASLHMPWNAFLEFLQEEVDAYNNRPHRRMPRIRDAETMKLRHMTPKEMWEQSLTEGFEPYLVLAEYEDELHRPYERRKVSRCEVKLPMGRYFSHDLEAYHGEWVMVGYDIHDNARVWVRDFDMRLLAVADLDGNKVPYFPTEMVTNVAADQRALLERNDITLTAGQIKKLKRRDGRMKVINKKKDEILAEYMGPAIENQPIEAEPLTIEQVRRSDAFMERMEQRQNPQPIKKIMINGRPNFSTDFEWLRWLLDNPDRVTDYDLKQVREKARRRFFMERLADEGIDIRPLLEMAA